MLHWRAKPCGMGAVARFARRYARTALALGGVALATGDVRGDERLPVEIRIVGPKAVRVILSEGSIMPCDSMNDRLLVREKLEPGTLIQTSTASSICLQHTVAPFTDSDWTVGKVYGRPRSCHGRTCTPTRDPTIRVNVTSERD